MENMNSQLGKSRTNKNHNEINIINHKNETLYLSLMYFFFSFFYIRLIPSLCQKKIFYLYSHPLIPFLYNARGLILFHVDKEKLRIRRISLIYMFIQYYFLSVFDGAQPCDTLWYLCYACAVLTYTHIIGEIICLFFMWMQCQSLKHKRKIKYISYRSVKNILTKSTRK